MPNGKVVFLDKVENYTQIKLPNGQYAYSAEYDTASNKAVGLSYKVRNFSNAHLTHYIYISHMYPDLHATIYNHAPL